MPPLVWTNSVFNKRAAKVVLITNAATGMGQIAVQWAKRRNCTVIGINNDLSGLFEREQELKKMGCDYVVGPSREALSKFFDQNLIVRTSLKSSKEDY